MLYIVVDCASVPTVRTCYNIGWYAYKTYNNTRRNLHNISVDLHKYCGLIQAVSVCLYFVYASCDMWTLYINHYLITLYYLYHLYLF